MSSRSGAAFCCSAVQDHGFTQGIDQAPGVRESCYHRFNEHGRTIRIRPINGVILDDALDESFNNCIVWLRCVLKE